MNEPFHGVVHYITCLLCRCFICIKRHLKVRTVGTNIADIDSHVKISYYVDENLIRKEKECFCITIVANNDCHNATSKRSSGDKPFEIQG